MVYSQKVAGCSRRTLPLKIPAGLCPSLHLHRRTNTPKLSCPLAQFFGPRQSLLHVAYMTKRRRASLNESEFKEQMLQAARLLNGGVSGEEAVAQLRLFCPDLSEEDAALAVQAAGELNQSPAAKIARRRHHLGSAVKWFAGAAGASLWIAVLAPAILGPDHDQGKWWFIAVLATLVGILDLFRAFSAGRRKLADPTGTSASSPSDLGSDCYTMRTGSWFAVGLFGFPLALGVAGFLAIDMQRYMRKATAGELSVVAGVALLLLGIMWLSRPRRRRFVLSTQGFEVPRWALKVKAGHSSEAVLIPLDQITDVSQQRQMENTDDGMTKLTVTFQDGEQDNAVTMYHSDGENGGSDFVKLSDALAQCVLDDDGVVPLE
jgi:hypothetical protein